MSVLRKTGVSLSNLGVNGHIPGPTDGVHPVRRTLPAHVTLYTQCLRTVINVQRPTCIFAHTLMGNSVYLLGRPVKH